MIRRLNYTGRKKIPRKRVVIRVVDGPRGVKLFTADYDLSGFDFPAEASVYIEAYNPASYMRFAFGTVAAPVEPSDTRLTGVTSRPAPRFRLKVVDETVRHGLLLGVADKLVPLKPDEDLENRQSLLPVEFCDLGDRAWRLDFGDWPVLELNQRIEGIGEAARAGGSFLGLVYPEVIRALLHEIVIEQGQTDPDFDEDDWTSLWLRYACTLPGVGPPPSGAGATARRQEWIDDTVQAFCRSRQARLRLSAAIEKELM